MSLLETLATHSVCACPVTCERGATLSFCTSVLQQCGGTQHPGHSGTPYSHTTMLRHQLSWLPQLCSLLLNTLIHAGSLATRTMPDYLAWSMKLYSGHICTVSLLIRRRCVVVHANYADTLKKTSLLEGFNSNVSVPPQFVTGPHVSWSRWVWGLM